MLNNCPVALNQSQFTCCHSKVLFVLATKLTELYVGIQFVQMFADLSNFHADHYPPSIYITYCVICDRILGNGYKSLMKYSVFLHVFTDISSYVYIFSKYLYYHFNNLSTELHVLCLNIL